MSEQTTKCQGKARSFCGCDRKPSMIHEGKAYCWQHDPLKLEAAAKAARLELAAKMKRDDEEHAALWAKRDALREAATRLRGVAMNPKRGLSEWYPAHAGSDSPHQDSMRAYTNDVRLIAEYVLETIPGATKEKRDGSPPQHP